jgi:BlaI family transcriptional regulator, penicillinase repressor
MRRPGPPRDIPPPLELECLKALWQLGHGSVRDVLELVRNRKLAYTTVMTVLDRLEKRGGVTRQKQGRAFIYEPKLTREVLRQFAVKDLVDAFFEGSEEALLDYLRTAATRGATQTAAERSAAQDGGGMEPALL